MRMARAHCVVRLSRTWGMSPVRFLLTLSEGVKEVPCVFLSVSMVSFLDFLILLDYGKRDVMWW